jgi:nucleoside 2-deoxyribosyltransferase
MKIYLAGPLFTTAEREFNAALAQMLRAAGHAVFLPQEQEQRNATARCIFNTDVRGLEECDVVVANMDGSDPDSGTCWEVGYAYKRKEVILYRTDIRSEAPPFGPYNLMLHQSTMNTLDCGWMTIEEVANAILEELSVLAV